MPERVKKTKCGGGGAGKFLRGGGYAGEGNEDKMLGCCEKKLRGGMPERVKKIEDKMRGGEGGLREQFEGEGVCRRG